MPPPPARRVPLAPRATPPPPVAVGPPPAPTPAPTVGTSPDTVDGGRFVHLLREVKGTNIRTKCGLEGESRRPDWKNNPKGWKGIRWSVWASYVSCPECLAVGGTGSLPVIEEEAG